MWIWLPRRNQRNRARTRSDDATAPWSGRFARMYHALSPEQRLLVEYKLFEPALYHMDTADWGQALRVCQLLGDRAQVAVDIGHHAHGTNIEHIAATLLEDGRLGSFDLNNRKYADDDLMVGSINPFELFLVFVEVVDAIHDDSEMGCRARCAAQDRHRVQHRGQGRRDDPLRDRDSDSSGKAWLVDREQLATARAEGDVVGAHDLLQAAFETDVRPLLPSSGRENGARPDPVREYLVSDARASRRETRALA